MEQSKLAEPSRVIYQETASEVGHLDFEVEILRTLSVWGSVSMVLGLLLRRHHDETIQGVGDQFLGWGAIDWLLAMNGLRTNRMTRQKLQAGQLTATDLEQKALTLERLLLFNAGLDVLYIAGGLQLGNNENPRWQGWSMGIFLQALFLLFFDLLNGLALRRRRS